MGKGSKVQVKTSDTPAVEEIKETDTFDSMLAKASVTFEGHPADKGEEVEEKEEDLVNKGPDKKDKEVKPPTEEIPLEVKPPKEPTEEGGTEKTTEEKLAETKQELDDLQKRFKNAQGEFTNTREENKRQREQNEKLSGQIQELMILTAKRNLESPATPKKDPEVELEEAVGRTLEEIENLDPASADYRAKSVKAWSSVYKKMRGMLTEETESRITSAKSELEKSQEDQRKKDREAENERSRTAEVTSHADQRATEAGLDMRQNIESTDAEGKKVRENSPDYDMFWKFAGYAQGATTEEKIEWTVNEVKKMKARISGPIVAAKVIADKTQKNNSVLERGGIRPAEVVQQEKPMTMDEALTKAQRTF